MAVFYYYLLGGDTAANLSPAPKELSYGEKIAKIGPVYYEIFD